MLFRTWFSDLRLTLRHAGRSKAFYASAVLTLALGMAAATVMFTLVRGIFKIAAAGGTPEAVTAPKGQRHLLPHALPGGNAILLTEISSEDHSASEWDKANVALDTLDSGERRVLLAGAADARYFNSGHLLYMKTGTLMAVPFDIETRQVTGAPMALIENVMQGVNEGNTNDETGAGQFVISEAGTLLYVSGGIGPIRQRTLVWIDRTGNAQPVPGLPPGPYLNPRISPDGQKIAMTVRRGATRASDLWVYDAARGTPTRLTFDGSNWSNWSPDGKRLVFGKGRLFVTSADGVGKAEQLTTGEANQLVSSWSPAGIAFLQRVSDSANGIWVLSPDGGAKPRLFIESSFALWHPAFSPDGRWMAYVSHESGGDGV